MKSKRLIKIFLSVLIVLFSLQSSVYSQQKVKKVLLQSFWWDYWNNNFPYGWANYLTELAPRLKAAGIDAIWIPPSMKNSTPGSVGYVPFDVYDLGDKYQKGGTVRDSVPPNFPYLQTRTRSGTKDDLLRMVAVMHANGIEIIEDMVLNHNQDAGSNTGAGGQDPEATYSMAKDNGYHNFRYVSYKTPVLDESPNDYWTRSGRYSKNYQNFHPNPANNCTLGDICGDFWGPDIDYETPGAFGQSSNIPTTGSATIGPVIRPYFNPAQTSNYMTNSGRDNMVWFKKQTGMDGWRFDAVKHYSIAAQKDFITSAKHNFPNWSAYDTTAISFGEWVSSAFDIDTYVNNVSGGGPIAGEKHTGTIDFSLRGYAAAGGLYSMVLSLGSFNMQQLPGCQQSERFYDYGAAKRVHRSVTFVNSHDTYRPYLDFLGNYLKPLGDASGWNTAQELGGNGQHIDAREPRLYSAYATIFAMDGNPMFFFEDLFNIGTTGKRYTHLPGSTTDLPIRNELLNIAQCHQKLSFKDGDYGVSTAATGAAAPAYISGNSGDHLVIERRGKAIIGITDFYNSASDNSQDETVYISVGDPSWYNKDLIDYSGAHGLTVTHVFGDGRVLIKTAPVGHNIPGVYGHGYSVWAPVPTGVVFNTVNDIYAYLATYAPARNPQTTQEWEMADDLGDSHCQSLGQGGRLPDNITNERIAGKIFAATSKQVSCKVTPEIDGRNITLSLYDSKGVVLASASGISTIAAPLLLNYVPVSDGWIVAKVRNTSEGYPGQKCYVNIAYTAPTVVNTRDAVGTLPSNISIWTGNKNNTDVSDCSNWEEGHIPGPSSNVIVYSYAKPYPVLNFNLTINKLTLQPGAAFTVTTPYILNILSQ